MMNFFVLLNKTMTGLALSCIVLLSITSCKKDKKLSTDVDLTIPDSSAPKVIPGYELDWNDEFNSEGKPDATKWTPENGFVRNYELQWYQLDNAYCKDGVLVIEGKRERVRNPNYGVSGDDWAKEREFAEYTSASLTTTNKKAFSYGIFEIRAKIDVATGLWPAIWTVGNAAPWPTAGEIDILEYYRPLPTRTPTIFANFCWGDAWDKQIWNTQTRPAAYFIGKDANWVSKFHVWKMDWNEERINLYLDDELLNTNSSKVFSQDGKTQPFLNDDGRKTMTLLLNMAIGAGGGDPTNTTFPRKYQVDYVRYYVKK